MKRKTILNGIITISAATFMVVAAFSSSQNKNKTNKADAANVVPSITLPTEINLNDTLEEDITNYYSSLNDYASDPSQLSGNNLLKHLKAIIRNNIQYVSFDNLSLAYVITDRDWINSDASTITGYDSKTDTISDFSHSDEVEKNPYIHMLYCDYDYQKKTKYNGDADTLTTQVSFDKEHAWSQSHGFSEGGDSYTGAGSDMHHIKAGTQYGNRTLHNNYSFGFVRENDSSWAKVVKANSKPYENKNKRGEPLFPHDDDQQNKVFEPQDCDKGDIARSLLYMVAAYNNLDGSTPTPELPALKLVNYIISGSTKGYSSDNLEKGYYGSLQDILAWHYMDPVDDYEIHRNNLIYNNYQKNRNPFIDYPEWVDYIWGTSFYDADSQTIDYDSTPTGYVDLSKDVVYGYRQSGSRVLTGINITVQPTKTSYYLGESFSSSGMRVVASYDDGTTANVTSRCQIDVDMTHVGPSTVTVTYNDKIAQTTITILPCEDDVESVVLDKKNVSIKVDGIVSLNATVLPISAANKNVTWASDDSSIATVVDGLVTGVSEGNTLVHAYSNEDSNIYATCKVSVRSSETEYSDTTYELINDTDDIDINRKIAIVSANNTYGMSSTQSTNNRPGVEIVKDTESNTIAVAEGLATFTIVESTAVSGTYCFQDDNGYLTADGTGKNYHLHSTSTITEKTSFTISIENGIASIVANGSETNNYMHYYGGTNRMFSCYGTAPGTTRMLSLYQQKAYDASQDIPVIGLSINKTELEMVKGDTETITATIYPSDATNQGVTWVSSAESVATVSDEGLVTAIDSGTAEITAISDDGEYNETCYVTVYGSGSVGDKYYQKITSLSDLETGKYVLAANVDDKFYPLSTTFPTGVNGSTIASINTVRTIDNKIPLTDAESYVLNIEVSGSTIVISNSIGFLYVVSDDQGKTGTALKQGDDGTELDNYGQWTVSIAEEGVNGTFAIQNNGDGSRYLLRSSGIANPAFGSYTNITGTNYHSLEFFKYVEDSEAEYDIYNFVSEFLSQLKCDDSGNSEPTYNAGYSWSYFETKYLSLTSTEQNELRTCNANEFGNDKEKCVARYDYIVKKYGTTKYPNWMNRTISPNANVMIFKTGTDIVFINIIIGSLLALSIGSFVFFRKRRKEY